MPISLILAIFALIALGAWVFFRFYSKHYVGEDAPEQSVQVTMRSRDRTTKNIGFMCNVAQSARNENSKLVCTITTRLIQAIKAP